MSIVLPDFTKARVLVVGDVMLDRYWRGDSERISPEAPVPVVALKATESRPGGAANVAINIASLGVQVSLCAIVGEDEEAAELETMLAANGVDTHWVHDGGRSTITKLRVMSQQQQLVRIDKEAVASIGAAEALATVSMDLMQDFDVVILSDYAKGALQAVANMIAHARKLKKLVLVDPKGSDFLRYKRASVITPNHKEFCTVVGDINSEATLKEKSQALRKELRLEALLVTLGRDGMALTTDNDYQRIKTQARDVFDVTGAGDTVIATLAACLGAGLNWLEAATLANTAAGIVVGKLGAAKVTPAELKATLHQLGHGGRSTLDPDTLVEFVRLVQSKGQKVVMTNGCFDILHAGHVAYLEQAKALGDKLVVAINDDASVSRLKGPERPLVALEDRVAVLSGLAAVDWVVTFSTDTPVDLITAVSPDVLVKGGDYTVEQIVGAKEVLHAGGKVEVLPFLPGRSTSNLVKSIIDKSQ